MSTGDSSAPPIPKRDRVARALAPEVRRHLRDQLRAAPAEVLQDAEAFGAVVQVVERIGRLAGVDGHGMGDAKGAVVSISTKFSLAASVPKLHPASHTPFARRYELVQAQRRHPRRCVGAQPHCSMHRAGTRVGGRSDA